MFFWVQNTEYYRIVFKVRRILMKINPKFVFNIQKYGPIVKPPFVSKSYLAGHDYKNQYKLWMFEYNCFLQNRRVRAVVDQWVMIWVVKATLHFPKTNIDHWILNYFWMKWRVGNRYVKIQNTVQRREERRKLLLTLWQLLISALTLVTPVKGSRKGKLHSQASFFVIQPFSPYAILTFMYSDLLF